MAGNFLYHGYANVSSCFANVMAIFSQLFAVLLYRVMFFSSISQGYDRL